MFVPYCNLKTKNPLKTLCFQGVIKNRKCGERDSSNDKIIQEQRIYKGSR